jgi:4-hydroxy-tetrahydrodipicolinate synthase
MASHSDTQLSGVIPPMLTPLTPGGEIDVPAVGRLVNHMIDGGVEGIFVLGSTGEGAWLTFEQERVLVEATIDATAGRVPVLVGVLEPSTVKTIEIAQKWDGYAIDALVVTTPYYFGTDDDTNEWHFRQVAAATDFPIVVYNIPPMTHNVLTPAVVSRLLDVDNIIGIKDSAGDWEAFTAFMALRERRPDFRVFQGNERMATQSLLAGADGIVPGLGNLIPQVFDTIYAAASAGNADDAQAEQAKVDALWHLHGHGYWLACIKYAGSLMGFGSGTAIGHASKLTDEGKESISNLLSPYIPVRS